MNTELAAGFITKDDGILTAYRRDHLHYELPGGKIELHETPEEAMIREMREELGIEVRSLGEVACFDVRLPRRLATVHVVQAEIVEGVPRAREADVHNEVRYQTLPMLRSYEQIGELSPGLTRIAKLLVDGELRIADPVR